MRLKDGVTYQITFNFQELLTSYCWLIEEMTDDDDDDDDDDDRGDNNNEEMMIPSIASTCERWC